MKKSILVIATALCVYSLNSCKPGKDDSTVSTGTATDSSMMTTPTTSGTGEPQNARPDSITNPSAVTSSSDPAVAGPNPAKKGKKGKISLGMEEPAVTGNTDMMDKEGYYTNVYPAYPGGSASLASFFEKNIQYPQEAVDNGVEGKVTISFTVDEKGKVASAKVTSPKIGYGVEEEALRVFNKMPSWTPGSLKGKNVKTRYNLPVRFQLEG